MAGRFLLEDVGMLGGMEEGTTKARIGCFDTCELSPSVVDR